MPKSVSAARARNHFADIIGEAHFAHEAFIVERLGKPFAVIIGYQQYQEMLRALERRQKRLAQEAAGREQGRLL